MGDLSYLPEYKSPDGVLGAVRRVENLVKGEEAWAKDFVGKKEGLWEERTFWDPRFLITHNCNFHLYSIWFTHSFILRLFLICSFFYF